MNEIIFTARWMERAYGMNRTQAILEAVRLLKESGRIKGLEGNLTK